MNSTFEYTFPSIKGKQAGADYYVSMCPLGIIPKIFLFDEKELSPKLRAQRSLNTYRIPDIRNYIINNPNTYVFSALTASIDSDVSFVPISGKSDLGELHIPMTATFVINDGQHRKAAIEQALRDNPRLANESIAVVFFLDKGLKRSQQMFVDLNKYAIRPSPSLGILYDHKDLVGQIAVQVVTKVPVFQGLVDYENSKLATRSLKLFTLSSIKYATVELLKDIETKADLNYLEKVAVDYWFEVSRSIYEWGYVKKHVLSPKEVRQEYIHTSALFLHALGVVGRAVITFDRSEWETVLQPLHSISWLRSNSEWEGRAMVLGRLVKGKTNVVLTANLIKKKLGIDLTDQEKQLEKEFLEKGTF